MYKKILEIAENNKINYIQLFIAKEVMSMMSNEISEDLENSNFNNICSIIEELYLQTDNMCIEEITYKVCQIAKEKIEDVAYISKNEIYN